MKRLLILVLCILGLCGCGEVKKENVVKEFSNKLAKAKSYTIDGRMQIISNEDKFDYNIEVSYLKDNNYKVVLVNQSNNHEQIILRNAEGVYVVTPSLNKSFKFQSEWPDNSSQAYILNSLLKDIENDSDIKFEKTDNEYIINVKVVYPNNSNLEYEKIYFDKNVDLKKVEVYNKNDEVAIMVIVDKINYKPNLEEDDFNLKNYISDDCCNKEDEECDNPCSKKCEGENCSQNTSVLESAIYPLYVPEKSALTSNEKVETENGNRLILSFAGEKDFILIEEASKVSEEMEIIPVYGDPHLLNSAVAALGANSVYWSDNNVDFYLASNSLSGEEMLTIAGSMINSQIVSQTK